MKPSRLRKLHRLEAQERASYWVTVASLIALLIFACFVPFDAHADESLNTETFLAIQKLDGTQKILYLTALSLTDYFQTVSTVIAHPDKYREMNPILGPHPSRAALAAFAIAGVSATAIIGRIGGALSPIARIAVDSIVASEQLNVWQNQYAMGKATRIPVVLMISMQF